MENNTAPLRSAAPSWTLAGDKQLLDILQNIHQSLMTRCQEVNRRLDEMVNALDGASVDLQNVNNKFMALSNSQFIESRVYDDDVDVTKQEALKEAPPPTSPPSDLSDLLEGVRTLQRCHETVRICGDSDTSDSEEEMTSVVLRPKDVYGRRPLPLVIGTAAWRSKWHAGLLPEDSDSDSSTSKPGVPDEEYSDSEPEAPARERHENETHLTETDGQGSTTSSEIFSEQDIILPVKPSPSDVAAELARKLRGPATIPEDTFVPPQPTTKKIYRPEQPTTGTIFSDEPPPFDDQSEADPYEQEEDDIFAELHKQPNSRSIKEQSSVADILFGGLKDDRRGLFSDFVDNEILPPPVASQKTTLFEDESEPELFASKPTNKPTEERDDSTTTVETVKKPIGGISLFGSNKGAESIGAAILKRNRRKSSSEEESQSKETNPPPKEEKPVRATEKDIFDDLFAKSEKEQKNKKETVNQVVKTDKVDLFSDNLFDDIDDIFTTDVKTVKVNKSNDKMSIFDDTEDDLFANIAVAESVKREVKSESQSKSVFDSDDDLFNDKVKPETKAKEISESSKTIISKSNEASKSLFDDDSSDSDMFTKLGKNNVNSSTNSTKSEVSVSKASEESKSLNDIRNNVTNNNVESKIKIDKAKEKPPLLFDEDDNDSDDIFNNKNKNTEKNIKKSTVKTTLEEDDNKPEIKSTKTSLFDNEDSDDLFTNSNKSTDKDNEFKNTPPVEVKVKTTNDYNIFNTTIKDADGKEKINDISHNNNTEKHGQDDVKNRIDASQNKTSIFDDDNDTIFGEVRPSNSINTSIPKTIIDTPSLTHLKQNKNETKPSTKEKQQNELKLDKNDITLESKTEKVIKESIVKEKSDKPNVDSSSKTIQEDNNSFFDVVKDVVFKTTDDIFTDLVDEPPAFEKPKEPKRSQNVNALFDDDSDDEALFFKRNDVTFDDKPNEEDDTNDPMFGIFHDEPPAIDVDFSTKSNKSSENNLNAKDMFKTIETSAKADAKNIEDLKPDNNHKVSLDNEDEIFKASVPTDLNNKSKTSQDVPKSLKDIDDFLNSDADSDLFQTTKLPAKPVIASKPIQKDILSTSPETRTSEEGHKNKDEIETLKTKSSSPKDKSQSSDTPDSPETKKIGKLKTMNFSIDVSTLLPGASPKKKSTEQTDGQIISVKNQEDLHTKENVEESKTLVKSISFESEPDSQILDNKLSKERAKIQVKRRPSTRRARQEAVKKSVLDLGEDSTDNSSSFDDAPRTEHRRSKNVTKRNEHKEQNANNIDNEIDQIVTTEHKETKDNDKVVLNDETESSSLLANENTNINIERELNTNEKINTRKETINNTNSATVKTTEVETNKREMNPRKDTIEPQTIENKIKAVETNKSDINLRKDTIESKKIENETKLVTTTIDKTLPKEDSKNVKSKIVYILNDEDIFNTPVEKKENLKSITNEDNSLFKRPVENEGTSISTIGNAYKEENSNKISVFDDMSDEENELFNTNKKITTKTKGILDSDSEDDLFFGKKEILNKVSRVKQTEDVKSKVNKSLFGDDDDDDDLFGAKVKVERAPSQPARSSAREVVAIPSQTVLDDPLSLLGDDDD